MGTGNPEIKDYWELSLSGELVPRLWRLNNGIVEFCFGTFSIEQAGWDTMKLITDEGKGPIILMSTPMAANLLQQYWEIQRKR